MSILVDEKTRVMVQGITGRDGSARARYMLDYGTQVVCGVTPGRGGTEVHGLPVYNTVAEAVQRHGRIDASVIFVPAPQLKPAVFEALKAGIKFITSSAERVPLHDNMEIIALAKQEGARILGPGSMGIVSPGKAVVGWLGANKEFANELFKPGPVGVMSRSGGQTGTVVWVLTSNGLGISTAVHVGTEPITGSSFAELLPYFEADSETKAVVLFGEIGTVAEEEAAEVIKDGKFTKPVVAYIAGAALPSGMRFSHASAIIERGRGTAESKIKALRTAGAYVVDTPQEIPVAVARILHKD
ncbi:MAG: CoA-binding protein [Dehalococcoidales bacterium]|nr:CoA-binding protein [Dehalococcoidales bacterium]